MLIWEVSCFVGRWTPGRGWAGWALTTGGGRVPSRRSAEMTSSEGDRQRRCENSSEVAAFLLGALEHPESFRAHLWECTICRTKVEHLSPAVGGLASAFPRSAAPADVKRRVLARVEGGSASFPAEGLRAGHRARHRRAYVHRFASRLRLASGAVLLLLVVAAVGATGLAALLGSRGRSSRVVYAQIAPALAGTTGTLRQAGAEAVMSISGIPPPVAGRVYEIWVRRGTGPPRATVAVFTTT